MGFKFSDKLHVRHIGTSYCQGNFSCQQIVVRVYKIHKMYKTGIYNSYLINTR